MPITNSVGKSGRNEKHEVQYVQALLNVHRQRSQLPELKLDGKVGPKTIDAIEHFQRTAVGLRPPDGRVDPTGRTIAALEGLNDAAVREFLVYSAVALALSVDPSLHPPRVDGREAVAMIRTMSVARG